MYPLSHRVEVGSTVQLHVLLSPGGGRLECGGESVEGRGRKEGRRRGGGEGGVCVGRIDGLVCRKQDSHCVIPS